MEGNFSLLLNDHIKNQPKFEAQDGSPLGIDFWKIFVGFGGQMEACWHPNRIKHRCQHRKAILQKTRNNKRKINDFSSFGGRT